MLKYPPHLPKEYRQGLWVGSDCAFNPQLTVETGPSRKAIKAAAAGHTTVRLSLSYRLADMEEKEPNIPLGEHELNGIKIASKNPDESINFISVVADTLFGTENTTV